MPDLQRRNFLVQGSAAFTGLTSLFASRAAAKLYGHWLPAHRAKRMIRKFTNLCVTLLLSGGCAFAQSDQIEPNAGSWSTWVISSGQDFRVPPPPDESTTTEELTQLREHLATSDTQTAEQIVFWDAGSPGYRWLELVNTRLIDGQPLPPNPHRIYAYLTMAIHDATIRLSDIWRGPDR